LRPQKRLTFNCRRTPNSPSQSVAALARWHAAPWSLVVSSSSLSRRRLAAVALHGIETCFYLSERDLLLLSFSIVSVVCFSIFLGGSWATCIFTNLDSVLNGTFWTLSVLQSSRGYES
jgi:hypothetical protein